MSAARPNDGEGSNLPCPSCHLLERLENLENITAESHEWHAEVRQSQQEMRQSQKRMELALIGDDSFGEKGLVKRLKDVEERTDNLNHKFILASGAATGLAFAFGKVWEYIAGHTK